MSQKQAKRLRQQQRAAGIEPHLDAKRRISAEAVAALGKRQTEAAAFRIDRPDEYARQQQEELRRVRRILAVQLSIVVAIR